MRTIKFITLFLLAAFIISSCCRNIYYVNDPVVFANVTKKHDFNVAGGLNTGNLTGGGHFHGSVALSNEVFVSGSFTNYNGTCSNSSTINGVTTTYSVRYSGQSFLSGAGYYRHLGQNFYFEGFAGGKFGTNNNKYSNDYFDYKHIKYILQPGITYTKEYFQAGFALRCGVIDYLPLKTGLEKRVPEIAKKSAKPYIDPSLYLSGGSKYVKLGAQISTTFTDNSTIDYSPMGYLLSDVWSDPLSISVFLNVTIPSGKSN